MNPDGSGDIDEYDHNQEDIDEERGYTADDIEHAKEIHAGLVESDLEGEYDGPETAMFSFGYGDVWLDGEVTTTSGVVFTVGD